MGQGGDGRVHSADLCEWREVVGILKHLQRGKAPGPDGILNEMMAYGGFRLVESLTQLPNLIVAEEYVPSVWRKSYVVPLFKGGEVEVGSNYRGIAIGTVWPKCCLTKGLVNLLRRKY